MSEQFDDLSKLDRMSIALFALMQQSGLKCIYYKNPNDLFSNIFDINDMTCQGDTFGVSINVNMKAVNAVEDTPEAIEKFAYETTMEIGYSLLNEKVSRLLQYQQKAASKIILPNH